MGALGTGSSVREKESKRVHCTVKGPVRAVGVSFQRAGESGGGGSLALAQADVADASDCAFGAPMLEAEAGMSGTQICLAIKGLVSKRDEVSEPVGLRTKM